MYEWLPAAMSGLGNLLSKEWTLPTHCGSLHVHVDDPAIQAALTDERAPNLLLMSEDRQEWIWDTNLSRAPKVIGLEES